MEPITFTAKKHAFPSEISVDFSLQLVGSLPVHYLTTMPMLPWVVAEVRRLSTQSSKKEHVVNQIRLCVSPACLKCEPDPGKSHQWDPLICSSIFEYKPQQVHKLIHNSHDPSYFACLIKEDTASQQSICYVFKADDQTKAHWGCKNKKTKTRLSLCSKKLPSGGERKEAKRRWKGGERRRALWLRLLGGSGQGLNNHGVLRCLRSLAPLDKLGRLLARKNFILNLNLTILLPRSLKYSSADE
uniref:TBC1 domain family member 1 n=1 Tax=Monodelphis domestica TaxID=13616 RepID=A0A5F8GB65_MONDO